jgi:hypothetical protein
MRRRSMVPLSAGRDGELSHQPPVSVAAGAPGAVKSAPSRPAGARRHVGAGAVLACAALLAAGCADAARPAAMASAQPSHAAPAGPAASQAQLRTAARMYLAIALPANRRLENDFDSLKGRDRDHLAAAKADLRDAAAAERLFDWHLLGIKLPPAAAAVARRLVDANQARARLTVKAAACTSLRQLRRYERRLAAANARVEKPVRAIRKQLGLPPPETS